MNLDKEADSMTISKRVSTMLLASASAAAVLGLAAAPALASAPAAAKATKLTAKVTGGGTYTATTAKTVLSNRGVNVTCTAKGKKPGSSASGSIPNGTHKGNSPVQVGTAAKLAFNNCTGPLGKVTTKITALPYKVSVDSKTNSKGQTDGFISGTKVAVSMVGCQFTVTGAAPGFYTNSKHTLTITSKLPIKALNKEQLTVSGVKGCAGLVKNGDHPGFTGTFTLNRKGTIKVS
jgi:hypothetical protein